MSPYLVLLLKMYNIGHSYLYERLPRPILWYRGKNKKRRQLQMRRTKRHASVRDFFRSRVSWFLLLKLYFKTFFFRKITLIIIQTNKLTANIVFWNEI